MAEPETNPEGEAVNKIWLQSYPPGVPAEIDLSRLRSLKELFESSCERFAQRIAYVQMGRQMRFDELERSSRAFGAWLQSLPGAKRGMRVAIMMPNLLQYPIAMFGALRAGFTAVNVNPLYTAPELQHQLKDSGAEVIVILENFAHVLEGVLAQTSVRHVVVTSVGELLGWPKQLIVDLVVRKVRKQVPAYRLAGALSFREALHKGAALKLADVDLGPDDLAYLQYTGGTTGVAKGAMLSHGNVCANILQAEAWLGRTFGDEPGTLITPIPLYHIFALTANCLLFARLGWRNVLNVNPRDLKTLIGELKKYPVAFLPGVNTLFNALLHHPEFDSIDFSHLKITLAGGMALQRAVAETWKARTGRIVTQAWGLTETSPAAAINPVGLDFNGSIGLPIPSTEISIRDDDGRELAVGQVGEICVAGPQVMKGYWNRPDETAKVMLPDGALRTGDIGRMDERGFVYIEDRKKDMILVSGFNVYPNEVEDAIASLPGVREVAAVAQPDEHSGEVVALFVVKKNPSLTEGEIMAHARKSLTHYKLPKHIYFRDELPKTNVGKILRRALRDEVAKGTAR